MCTQGLRRCSETLPLIDFRPGEWDVDFQAVIDQRRLLRLPRPTAVKLDNSDVVP